MTNGGPRLESVGWMVRRRDWLLLGRSMRERIELEDETRFTECMYVARLVPYLLYYWD